MPSGGTGRAAAFALLVLASLAPWLLPPLLPPSAATYAAALGAAVFAAAATWFGTAVLAPGRALGLAGDASWRARLLAGLGVGVVVYAAVFAARGASGSVLVTGGAGGAGTVVTTLLVGLVVAGYQAVSEEVVFRGAVFSVLPHRMRPAAMVAVSVALFGLYHLPKWPALVHGPYAIHLVLAGTAFAAAYLRTGSLWLGIGLHAGWNLGAYALLEAEHPLVRLAAPMASGWGETGSWLAVAGNAVLLFAALAWPVRERTGTPAALSPPCTVISDPGGRVRVQFPSGQEDGAQPRHNT